MTSDAVMLELKFVLEQFAGPLLNIMKVGRSCQVR